MLRLAKLAIRTGADLPFGRPGPDENSCAGPI